MMTPLTKYSKQLVEGALAAATVREAFRMATEECPGAVHMEVPEDIAGEQITYRPLPVSRPRRPVAVEKAVTHVVELLQQAIRPILLVGAGANRKRTSKMLTEFVETFDVPL